MRIHGKDAKTNINAYATTALHVVNFPFTEAG